MKKIKNYFFVYSSWNTIMRSSSHQFKNHSFYFTFLICVILTLTCFPVIFVTTVNPSTAENDTNATNYTAAVSIFTVSSFCLKRLSVASICTDLIT